MNKKVLVHALAMKLRDLAYYIESESESGKVSERLLETARDIIDEIEKSQ